MRVPHLDRPPSNLSFALAAIAAAPLAGCLADPAIDEPAEASTVEAPLVGGTLTSLRPEIGRLALPIGGCTGTLVDPRIVLTAAHCIAYTTGNVTGSFTTTLASGVVKSYAIDKVFSLGPGDPAAPWTGAGATDVALVRLADFVPSGEITPTYIWPSWPTAGTQQTIFGYGCQNRDTEAGGGAKQFYSFFAGAQSWTLCPGDSGGPVTWYGPADGGPVFAVNSAYGGDGDMFGDAATYGIPGVAAVQRFGDVSVSNQWSSTLAAWARQPGVKAVSGDFNGDGLTDVALVGGAGWTTIRVAFANGDGTFWLTDAPVVSFPGFAENATQAVAGDFNGDGRADIALAAPGWTTIPIAFGNGNGTFSVTNYGARDFAPNASALGAKLLVGDFDGDHDDDLAMTGGLGWSTILVASSNRNGTFAVTNWANPEFASWAQAGLPWGPGPQAVVGDFDGDHDADIALVGGPGWSTVPVAFSNRNGTFANTNQWLWQFPDWAQTWGARAVAGDFNNDGRTDIALVGGAGSITVPFALSSGTAGSGTFTPANLPHANVPSWSRDARFVVSGAFKHRTFVFGDGKSDIAMLGGPASSVPMMYLPR